MDRLSKSNGWALMPILVFMAIYLSSSLIAGDFYKMPPSVAFVVAALVALAMNRKRTFPDKLDTLCNMQHLYYPYLMGIFAVLAIVFDFPKGARSPG